MNSIDKLRGLRDEAASKMVDNPKWVCRRAEEIADEIEAEISERYMELPLDADGVPIHLGDLLSRGEGDLHYCYGIGKPSLDVMDEHCIWWRSNAFTHSHAPTVEDVLDEFASAYDRIGGEDEEDQKYLNLIEKYADKLREVMKDE